MQEFQVASKEFPNSGRSTDVTESSEEDKVDQTIIATILTTFFLSSFNIVISETYVTPFTFFKYTLCTVSKRTNRMRNRILKPTLKYILLKC